MTPAALVSAWTQNTFETRQIHSRLVSLGVEVILNHNLKAIGNGTVELTGTHGEQPFHRDAASVVLVTMRTANDALVNELRNRRASGDAHGIESLTPIGDCLSPGLIAEAVFSAHCAARELDAGDIGDPPFRVEQIPASFEPPPAGWAQ